MATATKSVYVALGRVEHDEHIHEVSEVIDDLDELEAKRLVALGVLLKVEGAAAVAFAQSLAAQRTTENISSLEAGTHQRIMATRNEEGTVSEIDAANAEIGRLTAALNAAGASSAIHAPTAAEVEATKVATKDAAANRDDPNKVVKDLEPTGTGSSVDAATVAATGAAIDQRNAGKPSTIDATPVVVVKDQNASAKS